MNGDNGDQYDKVNPEEVAQLRNTGKTAGTTNGIDVSNQNANDLAEP